MCGRFSLTASADTIIDVFGIESLPDYLPRYNIAPTTQIWGIRVENGQRTARTFRWGLIPFWARDIKIGVKLLNARSETVHQKPSFKAAFTQRRLLIPADGFFEWVRDGKEKKAHYFRTDDHTPFALAGLWERWFDLDGTEIQSATILTTSANDTLTPFHHRMPVILPPDQWNNWLDVKQTGVSLGPEVLQPAPEDLLQPIRVSNYVNNVRNQGPECLTPVQASGP